MFIGCKIELLQGANSLEIELLHPAAGAFANAVSFWGQYKCAVPHTGGIPDERKGWLFALAAWELRIVDVEGPGIGEGGGGLEYHELTASDPAAILSDAYMTERGIESALQGGAAPGWIHNGPGIGLNSGSITWRLSSFRLSGASAWQSP